MGIALKLIFTAIVTISQIVTGCLGYRQAPRRERILIEVLTAASVIAATGIVIEGIVPQFDYARLDLRAAAATKKSIRRGGGLLETLSRDRSPIRMGCPSAPIIEIL
jgi:hypothetical protein